MKTFKFLALSLLVATTGIYSFVDTAKASENKVVSGYNREFMQELLQWSKTASLQEISEETGIPINILRDFLTKGSVMKQLDEIYNDTPVANRSLQNITETLNRISGKNHKEQFVARWLKILGYEFFDNKKDTINEEYEENISNEDTGDSYEENTSSNIQENVSNEEIVNYIKQPGKTVIDAAKYFKKSGKSAREIMEIYANSNNDIRLVYDAASALDNNGALFVNGAVDSVINVIKSAYNRKMNREVVKTYLEKMDFMPIGSDDLEDDYY